MSVMDVQTPFPPRLSIRRREAAAVFRAGRMDGSMGAGIRGDRLHAQVEER